MTAQSTPPPPGDSSEPRASHVVASPELRTPETAHGQSTTPPSSHASREFRRLIEAFHDGVLVATRTGIAYANRALLDLLGYPQLKDLMADAPQDLIRRHLSRDQSATTLQKLIDVIQSQRAHERFELDLRRAAGEQLKVQVYLDSIEFEGLAAVMVTLRDITESQAIQDKLRRAERMASIGTLAAGVAHEINNPLAYVTTNIAYCMERLRYMDELLEGRMIRLESPASLRAMFTPMAQALTEAHQGTSRVATIVRDLRALTREDKEFEATVDLPRALAAAVHMSESEVRYRARLVTEFADAGAVWGNETRIVQIFLNLLVNAAQAFTSENRETNVITLRAWIEGEQSIAEVEDNGPGIPVENLERIFDPFFTTKPVGVGTGLGLSICHGLIESMDGSLTVRSEVGEGTTFRVTLKCSQEKAPGSVRKGPSLRPDIRARVLIVDDEPLILRSVARLLRDQHDVETAHNGVEGLAKIRDEGPFDLVVCDLMMPEMTGMDLHQAVQAYSPEIASRFVFLTGGAYTEQARKFLASVDNPKLDKPVQPNLLRSVVSSILRG